MIKLAIDIGSAVTKIYMSGAGIVLSEATCVAAQEGMNDNGQKFYNIKAFGDKAKALIGRTTQDTHIVYPVVEGVVQNETILVHLLSYFFEKIELTPAARRKTEVLFILPCGVSLEERNKYSYIKSELRLKRAGFVQAPIAAVLGYNSSLSETSPVLCVDIGYGITNIATLSLEGIISGMSINLGGCNIDLHLKGTLAEMFNLNVGTLTAEKVKNKIGSLIEDDNKSMLVEGANANSGSPSSKVINSQHVEDIMRLYVDKITEYIMYILNNLPAEVSSSVVRNGMYLSGGLVKLDGIAEYIGKKCGLEVNVSEEPQYAQVIGGNTIIANDYLREKLVQQL